MATITKEEIENAATEYAKNELGEDQFKKNKDAVRAIRETFIDGAAFIIELISGKDAYKRN